MHFAGRFELCCMCQGQTHIGFPRETWYVLLSKQVSLIWNNPNIQGTALLEPDGKVVRSYKFPQPVRTHETLQIHV